MDLTELKYTVFEMKNFRVWHNYRSISKVSDIGLQAVLDHDS